MVKMASYLEKFSYLNICSINLSLTNMYVKDTNHEINSDSKSARAFLIFWKKSEFYQDLWFTDFGFIFIFQYIEP